MKHKQHQSTELSDQKLLSLQDMLVKEGYLVKGHTGSRYLTATKRAWQQFQKEHALPAAANSAKHEAKWHPPLLSQTPELQQDLPKNSPPAEGETHTQPTINANTLNQEVINAALAEIGHKESGGNNRGVEIMRYKSVTKSPAGSPWCADFSSYILEKTAPELIHPTASSRGLMQQFVNHHAFHKASDDYKAKPGDLVFFTRGSGKGHVGFVVKAEENGTLHTVEANVGAANRPSSKRWNAAFPDQVRQLVRSAVDLKKQGLLGFGSLQDMAEHVAADESLSHGLAYRTSAARKRG